MFAKTSSFSNSLADNGQTVQQLIDNLNTVVATISKDGDKVLRVPWTSWDKLITGLSSDKAGSDRAGRDRAGQRHRVP